MAYAEIRLILCKLLFTFDLKLSPLNGDEHWIHKQEVYMLWEKPPLLVDFVPRKR